MPALTSQKMDRFYTFHSDDYNAWFVIENDGCLGKRYSGPYMKMEDAEADARYMMDGLADGMD